MEENRILIVNNQFFAGENRVWIIGANTPWHSWNDFGGNFDCAWWNDHFKVLNESGINATRVWITCNGDVGINIDDTGYISGATEKHWEDLDRFFQIARKYKIHIMATLISFDHFKNTYKNFEKWRSMITNSKNIDSYVENYVIPFTNRYKNNPYLWSVDLCNEPDWIFENKECGNIPWDNITEYFAKSAAAIHENSSILVTVGISMIKYNSDLYQGNKVSDANLQKIFDNRLARLDFYSPHHYSWQDKLFGIPFIMTPEEYKLDGTKPVVIGECPAKGSTNSTLYDDYLNACNNGWQGVMPWTSSGVDANGDISDITPASQKMRNNITSRHI